VRFISQASVLSRPSGRQSRNTRAGVPCSLPGRGLTALRGFPCTPLKRTTNAKSAAAAVLYSLIAQCMVTWSTTPSLVDNLWDVNLLRSATKDLPATSGPTTWTPAQRTLSIPTLPTGASRLEAWRGGPGSMPELLVTAAPRQTQVIIPATITFTPGQLYQLWLVAVNSRGSSPPGSVQSWTAV